MFEIQTLDIVLTVLLALTAAAVIVIALKPLRDVASYDPPDPLPAPCRPENAEEIDESGDGEEVEEEVELHSSASAANLPKVSVVVYAMTDFDLLEGYLEELQSQDYPDFEIIVVCDASAEASATLAEKFEGEDGLYITFVPPGSHNLSRRKLANTIGIKASSGSIIVTTTANASIPSASWLREIVSPIVGSQWTSVTLGYSSYDFSELKGVSRWYRQFDAVMASSSWLSSAMTAKPWRGDASNMAFSRQLFFDHKGYAKSINLHSGHDDLFVDEIADAGNTKVVLSKGSILTLHWGSAASRVWTDRKERHDFTRRWLPKGPQLRAGWLSLGQWLSLALTAATVALSLPGIIAAAVAVVVLLSLWGTEIYSYRKAAARLEAVRLWWAVPLFILLHPLANALFRLDHYRNRFKNFTWQRHR